MRFGNSGYHCRTYDPKELARLVKRVARKMKVLQKKLKFDAIAFRGSSGAAVAYPVSVLTGLHLIYVRKNRENSHGSMVEATEKEVRRYVILDDFVSSGSTCRGIINKLAKFVPLQRYDEVECVGICLYGDDDHPHVVTHNKKEYKVYSV